MFSELYKMFSKGLRISLNIFTDMNCVTLKYCYTTKIKHLLHLTLSLPGLIKALFLATM